jgi:hypothetical protein
MPDPDEADEAARQFREMELEGLDHGRMDLPEPGKKQVIDPEWGSGHYDAASHYARKAAKALRRDEVARAHALAAIGQIHAILAAAAAAAAQD